MSPIAVPILPVPNPLNAMIESVKALYGIAKCINDFLNKHIQEMKDSGNHTVSRTGTVLEAAKYGFGIGYITPVIIIAAGQMILGNPLSAAGAIVMSPMSPIAMTCAAVGAVYYGWNALTDQERNELLAKLSKGLEIGIEMIKSVIHFVIEKTKELLTSKNLEEIKTYIASAAEKFGKTLYDVTQKIVDKVVCTVGKIKRTTCDAAEKSADCVAEACEAIKGQGGKAADLALDAYESIKDKSGELVDIIKSKGK